MRILNLPRLRFRHCTTGEERIAYFTRDLVAYWRDAQGGYRNPPE